MDKCMKNNMFSDLMYLKYNAHVTFIDNETDHTILLAVIVAYKESTKVLLFNIQLSSWKICNLDPIFCLIPYVLCHFLVPFAHKFFSMIMLPIF